MVWRAVSVLVALSSVRVSSILVRDTSSSGLLYSKPMK